jgi:hypothetical protein
MPGRDHTPKIPSMVVNNDEDIEKVAYRSTHTVGVLAAYQDDIATRVFPAGVFFLVGLTDQLEHVPAAQIALAQCNDQRKYAGGTKR